MKLNKKVPKRMKSVKNNTWVAYVFLAPVIIVMSVLVFYPLFKGIGYSFTDINQYNMGNKFIEPSYKFIGLANYKKLLGDMFTKDSIFGSILKQTFIWTFVNVFFHFMIGLGLALLLNRSIKFRSTYRLLLLVPWAVPSFISAFSWRWMFNGSFGIINLVLVKLGFSPIPWLGDPFWSMVAVILTNVWLGVPFMMVTLLGGLQSIPTSLYEAARVDGASRFSQFWNITLPLLKPVAFTATLLGVIWTFNMFNVIYLVTGGGPVRSTEILVTYAYREAFMNWNFGMASTYGVIILSFLIIFSTIYARLLKKKDNEEVYY
ncbi:ABC transporter permease [Vulcanibacillus modesticaldus]|uniref:ABC transporter permease n=1 Tax=Vulcanibacillus modesticaldus TaxID=337097 RepID=A0A1D2YTF9_9BACI|nr:sugar ABC transporter permease [Vulcanibacillus modesticaldus]OEF98982.1 ABC transporter permease [Vulcanibacillus modesticaldus]